MLMAVTHRRRHRPAPQPRRDNPFATAATKRERRSSESGFPIYAVLRPAFLVSHTYVGETVIGSHRTETLQRALNVAASVRRNGRDGFVAAVALVLATSAPFPDQPDLFARQVLACTHARPSATLTRNVTKRAASMPIVPSRHATQRQGRPASAEAVPWPTLLGAGCLRGRSSPALG